MTRETPNSMETGRRWDVGHHQMKFGDSVIVRGVRCASLVLEDDVQSMNDSWNIAKDRQQNVDEEIGTTAALEEDTKRWEDDGKNDLEDIASSESHCE